MNNILIYGPPASGKSFIGKKIASMYGLQFIDLDEEIVSRTGDQISEIISLLGEEGFRKVEQDIFEDVVFTNNNAIISLGGGALLSDSSKKIAEAENTVLCLNLDRKVLELNFIHDIKSRPLCMKGIEQYRKLLDSRASHYNSFKNQIASMLIDPDYQAENGLSNIFVGSLISDAMVKMISVAFKSSRFAIVYDKNLKNVALNIKKQLEDLQVFSGMFFKLDATERNKNLKTVENILENFDECNLSRKDVVISIGGGITSDIAGFAASQWKRGIRWVNVPTTLLSIVDASVGGKTGVNFRNAKNIVGTFHKPAFVFIDSYTLKTLDSSEMINGYAESYKHYLLDASVKEFLECNSIVDVLLKLQNSSSASDYQKHLILTSFLKPKIQVVSKDPFEKNGLRINLNLGHTIAHALESKTKYKISHGEAVAIGICEELRMSLKEGILKNKELLENAILDLRKLGLPTELPKGITFEDLFEFMMKDKKNESKKIKFVLLEDFGKTYQFSI